MKRGIFMILLVGTASVYAWDPSLDTARGVDYLSEWEKDVILEMNKVRSDPRRYVEEVLRPLRDLYRGRLLDWPGQTPLQTQEGRAALEELIRELERSTTSLDSLVPSPGMSRAARDHVRDQGRTGRVGHDGSDRSDPFQRLTRYGQWEGAAAENIEYGARSGSQSVIFLLIDDGVRGRGHRRNILNPRLRVAGVATGPHSVYGTMTVTTFAQRYRERTARVDN